MTYARRLTAALFTLTALLGGFAHADEAAIRKNLATPQPIDEVRTTPIPGLYEVRYGGTNLIYSDENGFVVIKGSMIDTKNVRDLTAERMAKITAIGFDQLPLKDSFTLVRGNGKRKMAVFVDPNCGFCRHFEQELLKVEDVTISIFLLPVLGQDSREKAEAVWCSKDKVRVWQDWMVRNKSIPNPPGQASCDVTALDRNLQFGMKMRLMATPTSVFGNGLRVPGAMEADDVERYLADAGK